MGAKKKIAQHEQLSTGREIGGEKKKKKPKDDHQ